MADTEQALRLPTALRVSHQPIMAAGLTGSELIMTIAVGFGTFFMGAAFSFPLLGAFHFSILAGSLIGVACGLALRAVIVGAKRQKPHGYPVQIAIRFRHRIEPIPDLVSDEGHWDPLRHRG